MARVISTSELNQWRLLRRIRTLDAEIRERMEAVAALEAQALRREALITSLKKLWSELEKKCADASRSLKKSRRS